MPEISLFYGIRITMYWSDHNPPHFYAEYGKNKKDNKPLNRINPLIKKDWGWNYIQKNTNGVKRYCRMGYSWKS